MSLLPIESTVVRRALTQWKKLLQNSVGPCGKLQLFVSSTGLTTLTSSSSRLVQSLPPDNPILHFLIQAVRSQLNRYGDGGLYMGVLSCVLLDHLLNEDVETAMVCHIFKALGSITQSILSDSSSALCISISLDSVLPLLGVVKSVLRTKPGAVSQYDPDSSNSLAMLMVRGFLTSAESSGRLLLDVRPGCGEPVLLDGVTYLCTDCEHDLLCGGEWKDVSILLITTMLSDQPDPHAPEVTGLELAWDGHSKLRAARVLLDTAVTCGVRLIACQRVVHPSLLLEFRRRGLIMLSRLGRQLATSIELLSGATPISSLAPLSSEEMCVLMGCVPSIKHIERSTHDYLFLDGGNDSKVLTLSVLSVTNESAVELEVVVQQGLRALSHAIRDGEVVPGGGCCEMYLGAHLWYQVQSTQAQLCLEYNCSDTQLKSSVRSVQLALLSAVGLVPFGGKLAVDSIHHHAWKSEDYMLNFHEDASCCCGFISARTVLEEGGTWETLCDVSSEPLFPHLIPTTKQQTWKFPRSYEVTTHPDVTVDVISSKLSALQLGFDTCIGIANIGAIVLKEDPRFENV